MHRTIITLTMILIAACQNATEAPSYDQYLNGRLEQLKQIRQEKQKKVFRFLEFQRSQAQSAVQSETLLTTFQSLLSIYREGRWTSSEFMQLNREMEERFVFDYGAFYDLLFIDNEGVVFYSVKMESDFLTNFNEAPYANTSLARIAKNSNGATRFVDFEYYQPSDEPAAFYLVPVSIEDQFVGQIAFQVSINRINSILTDRSNLGATGEVYLVNENQLMLSQSRFISDDTVLKKKIDTESVRTVLAGHEGGRIILDYRGYRVLSVFDQFLHEGVKWGIIAEIDEDEVINDYYSEFEEYLFDSLVDAVVASTVAATETRDLRGNDREGRRVDVGEFLKADENGKMYTVGVASCTAVVTLLAQRFSYLAHLSPLDAVYVQSAAGKSSELRQDILARMLDTVVWFDVKPHERRLVNFGIMAPHRASVRLSIRKLMQRGFYLSQVRIGILPDARSVEVASDQEGDFTGYWYDRNGNHFGVTRSVNLPSLADLLIRKSKADRA